MVQPAMRELTFEFVQAALDRLLPTHAARLRCRYSDVLARMARQEHQRPRSALDTSLPEMVEWLWEDIMSAPRRQA